MRAADLPGMPRGERGQALPFMLVWILVAVAFIAATVTVGQAVNRRSGLQLLADAGAYTGATTMAVGLNSLAKVNRELIRLWDRTDLILTDGVPCPISDATVQVYDELARELGHTYESLNRRWQSHPAGEAKRVTYFNIYDLFPGERQAAFRMGETDRQMGLSLQRDANVLVPSVRETRFKVWACTYLKVVQPRAHEFEVHYRRSGREVQSFAWVVRSPVGTPLLGASLFGPDAMPPMVAAAVAKPVGGSIEDGRPTYVSKMIALSQVGVRQVRDGVPRALHHVRH